MRALATTLGLVCLWIGVAPDVRAQEPGGLAFGLLDSQEKEEKRREEERRAERDYERGNRALEKREWKEAVDLFSEVASAGGSRADGALYWKAYAMHKLGQRPEALATLEAFGKAHLASRWLDDARALEVEIRQASGQRVAPETQADEELKLMAINGLLHSDPEQAVPMLEKLLQGSASPKLKERALFVLAQSRSTRSKEVIGKVARGGGNPDLQLKALSYLGMFGGKESRDTLAEIYSGSTDLKVKRAILRSFMVGGERARLVELAKSEKDAELRREAVRQLGSMGAQEELWTLYQGESSVENRESILRAMFVAGNATRLLEVARTDKEPALRRAAIRQLGVMGKRGGEGLGSIYESDKDVTIRKAVINALFVQGNAKALVDLARKETDPELKKEIVSKLSVMRSKEATDYLMELLK